MQKPEPGPPATERVLKGLVIPRAEGPDTDSYYSGSHFQSQACLVPSGWKALLSLHD